MKSKQKTGFTLIELLVVISIIGMLASIVLVGVNSARRRARDAKRLSDVNQLVKGLELFYNSALAYPTGTAAGNYVVSGGRLLGSLQMTAITPAGLTEVFTPTYMTTIPQAPSPADGSCTIANNPYFYETNSAGTTFTITFCLGEKTGEINPGVRYLTPIGIR